MSGDSRRLPSVCSDMFWFHEEATFASVVLELASVLFVVVHIRFATYCLPSPP